MPDFPVWTDSCDSLVRKHLTRERWEQLSPVPTANGYTLEQAIRSGVEQPDSAIGIYAGDAESYERFAPLLTPIIFDYHGHSGPHPADDFSVANLPELSPQAQQCIQSTRIRVGRNLAGFPLGPALSAAQRQQVEHHIVAALKKLPAALQGEYLPLSAMSPAENAELIARHLLFKNEDRFLRSANLMRDWPAGRGLFLSDDTQFSAWVNEEDQLRIIALQPGGDMKAVLAKLAEGIATLAGELAFLRDPQLGYLASCPTNIGTAMRCSVHMQLAPFAEDEPALFKQADTLGLQVRGVHGEHSASQGGIYDISNRMRLGVTETEAVTHLINGINTLAAIG